MTAPVIAYVIIASLGCLAAIRARRLALLVPYLGFVAAAGVIGAAVLHLAPSAYRATFWVLELGHNLLLCGLALEIIANLLPKRFVRWWGVFLLLPLGIQFVRVLPETPPTALLNLSLSADMVAGLLLVALAFVRIEWPRGFPTAVAGVAAIMLGNALPGIQWIQGNVNALVLQLGSLPGLAVLAYSGRLLTSEKLEVAQ